MLLGTPDELLEALMASINTLEASTATRSSQPSILDDSADQNSRQSFLDETLDGASSNQKSRPERPGKHTRVKGEVGPNRGKLSDPTRHAPHSAPLAMFTLPHASGLSH